MRANEVTRSQFRVSGDAQAVATLVHPLSAFTPLPLCLNASNSEDKSESGYEVQMQNIIECWTIQDWSFGVPERCYHSEVVLDEFRGLLLLRRGL